MPILPLSAALLALFALGCRSATVAPPVNTPPAGFTALFSGHDLAGWTGGTTRDFRDIEALPADQRAKWHAAQDEGVAKHWRVDAATGDLVSDGQEPHLVTRAAYGDFEMFVDYKIQANGDSGIYLRGVPQVQIWDPANPAEQGNGAAKGSGALWNNNGEGKFPLVKADHAPGLWNRLHITLVGSRVWVELNGLKTVDGAVLENYHDRKRTIPASGPIHLQTHGSEARFRNVCVRPIGAEEAGLLLTRRAEAAAGPGAFTDLFEGGLAGWQGSTGAVDLVPGGIHWKKGGGTLFTRQKYADFEQIMEFKLTPGGNNGLALRYPGRGGPSHTGIELQILDSDHPRYRAGGAEPIHDYQAQGAVYGFVNAQRGCQRPAGEWNHQVVRVQGTRYRVELNGFVIVDADIKGVKPLDGDAGRAGDKALDGHFGFAGHGDEVEFRKVLIRRL